MKRILFTLVAASLGLMAAQPPTGVTGTFHDLSPTGAGAVTVLAGGTSYTISQATGATSYTYTPGIAGAGATTVTQVCIYCHAPHQAKAKIGPSAGAYDKTIPLWNHYTTQATYTMYTSPTGTMVGTPSAGPTGISVACLSCHDGTVGLASIVMAPYGQTVAYNSKFGGGLMGGGTVGGMNLGTDLSGDHPISVTYQDDKNTALKAATSLGSIY